jgi:tetratricopeptide (TPR) repeat protein
LSVLSAEPVGVWRIYHSDHDILACRDESLDLESARPADALMALPGEASDGGGRVLLSACMIVRNEQAHLRRCLDSLQNVVDETVIVDTGSTDKTREIASTSGARVFDFRWSDDFSAARNEALRHVRGEWVLSVDADETMHPVPRAALEKKLSASTIGGYYVLFRRRRRLTPNWQMKLFRNHPGIRHKNVIHEAILPSQVRSATGCSLGKLPLLFEHTGYDGDLSGKHARNLPLLLKQLQEQPDHPRQSHMWHHLADIYEALGRIRQSLCAREHAVRLLTRKGKLHPVDCAAYLGLLARRIAGGQEADGLLEECCELFPDNLQLLWLRARWYMKQGKHRRAVPLLKELIARGRDRGYDHWVGYDQLLFGELSMESLAVCHEQLGHRRESLRYWKLTAERATEGAQKRTAPFHTISIDRHSGFSPVLRNSQPESAP